MAYALGKSDNFMNILNELYTNQTYIQNLNIIKQRMREVHSFMQPQFDDIEAEIVCLILMHFKPKSIYEFSPCGGWSTLYMLNTLDLLNIDSKIDSFDIEDNCTININKFDNLKNKWQFHLGDVQNEYINFPDNIDYLFIDSDHSHNFTKNYIENLLNQLLIKLKNKNKKIFVSVHDVFHSSTPSEEGILVIEFLEKNNIEYFSPLNDNHQNDILQLRLSNNVDTNLVHCTTNPCIYFILG